jgi:tRNA (guanine10-N2)-dimethyltransferase
MKYLFELLKENKTIPKAEIISCLNSEKIIFKIIDSNSDVLIIETKKDKETIKKIGSRLAFSYYVSELLFFCEIDEKKIRDNALKNPIENIGTIAIKYRKRTASIDTQRFIKIIADIYTQNRKVNLNNPDIEVRIIYTENFVYVGIKLKKIERSLFESRKAQYRPFFSPISLHPKIARALVNLSGIKKGEILYDPFCGTGGILIEAGLMGIEVIGSDIEEKMIRGCKKNLTYYNIEKFTIFNSDIGEISSKIKKNIDVIVADFPYGKSTTTKREKINELYNRAFHNILLILKKDGKAVVGISSMDAVKLGENYLSLIELHKIHVHKSLTRYFAVYIKQ